MDLQSAGSLDLPATALALVASCLGPSDKKSLALTCSAMTAIIRPLWTSLLVDLVSEEPPPAALVNFSGITTIVVVDLSALVPGVPTSTEPAFHNQGNVDPGTMHVYSMNTLGRLCTVIGIVLTAAPAATSNE